MAPNLTLKKTKRCLPMYDQEPFLLTAKTVLQLGGQLRQKFVPYLSGNEIMLLTKLLFFYVIANIIYFTDVHYFKISFMKATNNCCFKIVFLYLKCLQACILNRTGMMAIDGMSLWTCNDVKYKSCVKVLKKLFMRIKICL